MHIPTPTPEQLAVIAHPLKHHARVLAVAGSGKTTTIVLRVAYLIKEMGVAPAAVRVFAYNALARQELKQRIESLLPEKADQPRVDTFHSFAFRWIKEAISRGLLPEPAEWWLDEESDRSRLLMHRAIQSLVQEGVISDDSVDVDAVASAITLWKAAHIPPGSDRAAHASHADIPLVYARYEEMRMAAQAVGFDDFVALLLQLHATQPDYWRRMCGGIKVLIVDEYQDVNYAQQRLVEAIAGDYADVMVVGDDDQTIYEWRGARPDFLLQRFASGLSQRPVRDYPLSVSFRFGPLLAQCAHNVIVRNSVRFTKDLVAADWHQSTEVRVYRDTSEQAGVIDTQLCGVLQDWLAQHAANSCVVIGRTIAQLQALEVACILAGVPYQVLGRAPFYERREHRVLQWYVDLAQHLDAALNDALAQAMLRVANVPMRGVAGDTLKQLLRQGQAAGWTVRDTFAQLLAVVSPQSTAHAHIDDWVALLESLQRKLQAGVSAYELLSGLVQSLRLDEHFLRAFGRGEAALERTHAVRHLIAVVEHLAIPALEFCAWMRGFDHTAGREATEQVVFTTVYRVKGLEYEHVVMPQVLEGYFPALGSSPEVYDRANPQAVPAASEASEAERRLFYVAVTRAKTCLTIGVPQPAPGLGCDALPSATMSRFLYEMRREPTENILIAAESDAEMLAETLHTYGISRGFWQHLQRYLHDNAPALQVLADYSGEWWPMRPARPKRG